MKFKSIIRIFIVLFVVSTVLIGYSTATVSAKSNKTKQNSTSTETQKGKQQTQNNKSNKSDTGSKVSAVSGSSISVVSGSSISLAVGEKQTVIVKDGMHYSIADNSIIKVNRSNKNFTITGKAVGVTTITVKDKRMNVLATIEVTVTEGSKENASDEIDTVSSEASSIDSSSDSTSSGDDGNIESTQSSVQDSSSKQNPGHGGKAGKNK